MVEDTIDLDELANHNYVILPTIDEDLQRFREELLNVRDQLDDEHRRVGNDLGLDIDKKLHLENHQVYKYSFRITKAVCPLALYQKAPITKRHCFYRRLASFVTRRNILTSLPKSLVPYSPLRPSRR